MPDVHQLLMMMHVVLLLLFTSATSLLMLASVANRLRIRRTVVSWPSGPLYGYPLWPTLFVLLVLLCASYSLVAGIHVHPVLSAGYLFGGIFWFTAVRIASTTLVTDFGIIRNVNRTDQAVAWGQMVDYFMVPEKSNCCYVFFYQDPSGARKRIVLKVPQACQSRFDHIVTHKLDARFNFSLEQVYGKQALNG